MQYVFHVVIRYHSTVCNSCCYDVAMLYVFDVLIRCHTTVSIWRGYAMSQCRMCFMWLFDVTSCMYLMWLSNAIVLYVFDVVM